jgi:hypothetical protein
MAVSAPQVQEASALSSERVFFASLVLATAIPLIWLGFGVRLLHENTARLAALFVPVMAITSFGHVGATTFFYLDSEMTALIKQNRLRFFVVPLLIGAAGLLIYRVSANLQSTSFVWWYVPWLYYHYQRQNYGMIAFAAQSSATGKLPREVNWMLNLAVAAAIIRITVPSLATIAVVLFLVASALFVVLLRGPLNRCENRLVLVFITLSWIFFIAAFLSTDRLINFWPYAIAHGAQYLIFMRYLPSTISADRFASRFAWCP